jgi:hypothetical protein
MHESSLAGLIGIGSRHRSKSKVTNDMHLFQNSYVLFSPRNSLGLFSRILLFLFVSRFYQRKPQYAYPSKAPKSFCQAQRDLDANRKAHVLTSPSSGYWLAKSYISHIAPRPTATYGPGARSHITFSWFRYCIRRRLMHGSNVQTQTWGLSLLTTRFKDAACKCH